jgi:hypothetical protein
MKFSYFFFFLLILFPLASALDGFGFDDPDLPKLNTEFVGDHSHSINYSLVPSVNSTEWWITSEDLFPTLDGFYLNLSGTNADRNIDIGIYNLTTTGWLIPSDFRATTYRSTGSNMPFNFYDDGSEIFLNHSGENFNIEGENTKLVLFNEPNLANDFKVMQLFSKEAADVTEFVVTKAGDAHASYFVRSLAVAGNSTNVITPFNCSNYTKFIDCKTDVTGADFYVQDDVEINGSLYVAEGNFKVDDDGNTNLTRGNLTNVGSIQATGGNNILGNVTLIGDVDGGEYWNFTTINWLGLSWAYLKASSINSGTNVGFIENGLYLIAKEQATASLYFVDDNELIDWFFQFNRDTENFYIDTQAVTKGNFTIDMPEETYWKLTFNNKKSIIANVNETIFHTNMSFLGDAELKNISAQNISATGNISASYFIGDGSQLTGVNVNDTNINVKDINATTSKFYGNMNMTGNTIALGNNIYLNETGIIEHSGGKLLF